MASETDKTNRRRSASKMVKKSRQEEDQLFERVRLHLSKQLREDDEQCFQNASLISRPKSDDLESSPRDRDAPKRTPSFITFEKHLIETWFSSAYPCQHTDKRVLHICEFCLEPFNTRNELQHHLTRKRLAYQGQHQEEYEEKSELDSSPLTAEELAQMCCGRGSHSFYSPFSPPGNEIYRSPSKRISVFEVDGSKALMYCQNLCLLAKMFLDHKTVHYDVQPFLFYVLTLNDQHGCHLVGYFSKQKHGSSRPNVACIMVMPQYQSKGYGRWLIDFSYLLSRIEKQPSGPETPLSTLGQRSYESYWSSRVLEYFGQLRQRAASSEESLADLSLQRMSLETGIQCEDLAATIARLQLFGPPSGRKKRPPLNLNSLLIDKHAAKSRPGEGLEMPRADCLIWTPFITANDDDEDEDESQEPETESASSIESDSPIERRLRMLGSRLLQKKRKAMVNDSDDDQYVSKKAKVY